MAIIFLDPRPIQEAVVRSFEQERGFLLPAEFVRLLTTVSNGGHVESAETSAHGEVGLRAMFGIGRNDRLDIDSVLARMGDESFPPGMIPIASSEGGNLVCISVRDADHGSVWFWDHEIDPPELAVTLVSADLDLFIADLRPYSDEGPVVGTAWIDPEFAAKMRAAGNLRDEEPGGRS